MSFALAAQHARVTARMPEKALRVSSSNQGFLAGVGSQNERNRLTQVRQAFFARFSLTIRARHFRAVRHVPGPVLFDDRGELVSHWHGIRDVRGAGISGSMDVGSGGPPERCDRVWYTMLRTSRLVREGDAIMMQRSNAFFAVILARAAIRLIARGYFDTVLSVPQTGRFFICWHSV
jgi:hypothetical protein